jgi:hypothetical protein
MTIKDKLYTEYTNKGLDVLYMKVEGNVVTVQVIARKATLQVPLIVWAVIAIVIAVLALFGLKIISETVGEISKTAPITFPILAIAILLVAGAYLFKTVVPTVREYYPPKPTVA